MPGKKALLITAAALLLAGGAVGAALWKDTSGPRFFREDYLYSVVQGDLRYDFDPAWRTETLSRLEEDGVWRSIDRPDPSLIDPLRTLLLAKNGFKSTEEIPVEGKQEVDSLKGLGY